VIVLESAQGETLINHVFLVIAGVLVYAAVAVRGHAFAWVAWWLAAVLFAGWVVYLVSAPGAFMKRRDGTLPWYAWVVWAPLFIWQWIGHEFVRAFQKEPVANEVAPGVWVGRRPRARELPPGIAIVVDLCAEMAVAPGVKTDRDYLTIPTLDARAPTPAQIAAAVDQVLAARGPAFIHCAFGHGRSATVAAAVLVRRGDNTLDDVEARMKAIRPRIGLNAHQRAALAAATRS
jgi:protein-tyrosine phosphatase